MSSVEGLEKFAARLRAGEEAATRAAESGLYQAAETVVGEAAARAPKDTGALRASAHVQLPERRGDEIVVEFGMGGPAAPYAVVQHEDLSLQHSQGEAKFLEKTLLERKDDITKLVAERIRAALGGS